MKVFIYIILFISVTFNVILWHKLVDAEIQYKKVIINTVLDDTVKNEIKNKTVAEKTTKNSHKLEQTHKYTKPLDKIILALNKLKFSYATDIINEIPSENINELDSAKAYWFKYTKDLIASQRIESAESSIMHFLEYSADDLDFLFLLVELYQVKEQIHKAIQQAYDNQYHTFEIEAQELSIRMARNLAKQHIMELNKAESWHELTEFSYLVKELDPENLTAQWYLAQAQFKQAQFEQALDSLNMLLDHDNYKVRSQKLLDKIRLAMAMPALVPLEKQGKHFVVNGLINKEYKVSLMLDTGASISLISQSVFNEISTYSDIEYIKDIVLNTAGGQITASIYNIATFELQGYSVDNLLFAVSPHMSDYHDGLLGMNYLSQFDFHINQTENLLKLEFKQ